MRVAVYNYDTQHLIGFSAKCASQSIRQWARQHDWVQVKAKQINQIVVDKAHWLVREPVKRFSSSLATYCKTVDNFKLAESNFAVDITKDISVWTKKDPVHFASQHDTVMQWPIQFELVDLKDISKIIPLTIEINTSERELKRLCNNFANRFADDIKRIYNNDYQLYNSIKK